MKGNPDEIVLFIGEIGARCYGNDSFILIEDVRESTSEVKKIVTIRLFKLREGTNDTQYIKIYLSSVSAKKSHAELKVKAIGKGLIDRRWRKVVGWLKGSTLCN